MRKFKRVLVAGTATTMLLGSVLNVSAAGLRDIFDAKYYADSYSDLKETFGYDENQLYNHFITYGLKEGRNMSPILDVVAYREAYGDLNEAFGDNWDAYVNHFLDYGASEMRDKGVLFNPVVYADAYGDIKTAYGSDLMAIARHYLTFGKSENRTLGTSNGYADMATAKAVEWAAEQAAQKAAQQSEGLGKPSVTWSSWGGRTEYEYDSLGNCIAEIYYDAAGNRESYTESVYDGKKKQKWTQYDGDGNVTSYSTYEWDGNKVKISHYDASGNPDGYTDCETDSHFNFTRGLSYDREGKLIYSYVQTFDGDDNVLTAAYYDADGNEYSNTSYTYYENGVIKTVIYIETSIEGRFRHVMEYNENGSLVSSRTYSDEKLGYEAAYEYSAEGPVTKCCSVSYREDGSVSFKCDTEYAADGGYTYSSEDYDSDGILWNKSIEVYNAQNEQVRGITYNFNNDGRVSYKCVTEYAADGGYASSWERYDSDGVLISKRSDVYNAQKEQVKDTYYSREMNSVIDTEFENGRAVKVSFYYADDETLYQTITYTYVKKDYGYDRLEVTEYEGVKITEHIEMIDEHCNHLGYKGVWSDGTVVENWTSEGKTKYYHADGKLYREEIKDASWTTVAAYEYEYDADGNQIVFELVKNENGKWVRPAENPGTDEPGTDAPGAADPGTDEPGGSVSGGDADPGSVSGGDAASSVSGNDAAGN